MRFNATSTPTGRILIAYYSLTGNTARVAQDLAVRLGADIERIHDTEHGVGFYGYLKDVVDAVRGASAQIGSLTKDPTDYALTIIGTPVWAGRMPPAVRTYLQQTRQQLNDVAFFVTSGDTPVGKMVPALELLSKRYSVASAGFDARTLQKRELYETKLATFVSDIQRTRRREPVAIADDQLLDIRT